MPLQFSFVARPFHLDDQPTLMGASMIKAAIATPHHKSSSAIVFLHRRLVSYLAAHYLQLDTIRIDKFRMAPDGVDGGILYTLTIKRR